MFSFKLKFFLRDEWNVIRFLADHENIIIKKVDKRSRIVIWGRNDYLMEVEKQLRDKKVYQEVSKFIKIKTFYLS